MNLQGLFHFTPAFLLMLLITACSNADSPPKHSEQKERGDSAKTDTERHWGENYSNARYDISLRKPEDWILLEEPKLETAQGTFAINIFKRGTGAEAGLPLDVHAKPHHSYVAIWPHGIGTELPASQYTRLDTLTGAPNLRFEVNGEKSKALVFKDGSAWAYFIVPENPPDAWGKYGFIFAQIRSTNNSANCYGEVSGEKIHLDACDYLADDRYVRQGDLNKQDARTIRNILKSISLEPIEYKPAAEELIKIEQPLPNTYISSPLTVKGKARGLWYFEGRFSVELVDAAGNTLAEKQAKADGKWMTDDFVPFSLTLEYKNAPDDERGKLIFHRANPSGKPEKAAHYTQPVIFPPK